MILIYYMKDIIEDPRLENQQTPQQFLTKEELFSNCGVKCLSVDINNLNGDPEICKLKQKPNFMGVADCTFSKAEQPNYEKLLKLNFMEHLHTEEKVRLVIEGCSYFDVRDKNDRWIRIRLMPGDLIMIPSGAYHRCTTDVNNHIKGKIYFMGNPESPPHIRPAEDFDCRKKYLKDLSDGVFRKNTSVRSQISHAFGLFGKLRSSK